MRPGERARKSVAYYRMGWGILQATTALLLLIGRQLLFRHANPGLIRSWLRAMILENPFIEQIRESSIHIFGIPFRLSDATFVLLILGVLNVLFGLLLLRSPRRARLVGMVVFGVGFFVGVGSVILHPSAVRIALTLLDFFFFAYFTWYLPRSLQAAVIEIENPLPVDKTPKNA